MPIQILPARLANQIAAGEVVERPASVIKELVENALDAGSTAIEIEVEKGGSKLIRIRDNGCGVSKDELTLALSRHATSKISCFDDLENITSLGFRGEALASISSVSRLKLTSKPAEQSEAWQAYAEGRDMEVKIVPAAHPDGTTIEVVDLFFNTPARRKFLRSEKTEFYHIDELIKRIALSRFDVQFTLKHNGKVIRKLPLAKDQAQQERRIGQICSKAFADASVYVSCDYEGIKIEGYVALPGGCRNQNDIQYSYVNGRMMRDKLINHAIRQAYGQQLSDSQYPAYVLYLTVDPKQVDVNVHPAKHEVRFHQARLVHDFIVEALEQALSSSPQLTYYELEEVEQPAGFVSEPAPAPLYPQQVVESIPPTPEPMVRVPQQIVNDRNYIQASYPSGYDRAAGNNQYRSNQPSRRELDSYHQALSSFSQPIEPSVSHSEAERVNQAFAEQPITSEKAARQTGGGPEVSTSSRASCLAVIQSRFALYQSEAGISLLDLVQVSAKVAVAEHPQGLLGQPLLLPVKMPIQTEDSDWLKENIQSLAFLGIDYECMDKSVVIRKVPGIIRNHNISEALGRLFRQMSQHPQDNMVEWLYRHFAGQQNQDLMSATQMISRGRENLGESEMLQQCGVAVDLSSYIAQLSHLDGSECE